MNKKAIFGVIFTLSLVFSGLNISFASATDTEFSNETINQPIELSDDESSDESGVMPISETDANASNNFIPGLITDPEGESGFCLMEGDIAIPCPSECVDESGKFQPCVYDKESDSYTLYQTILDEGTADEPLVVCADASEPGCENTNSTPEEVENNGELEEIEPETWPLIVSLVTLGATVVFVIIINLFGRKNK